MKSESIWKQQNIRLYQPWLHTYKKMYKKYLRSLWTNRQFLTKLWVIHVIISGAFLRQPISRTYKPWIGNCLLTLQSYSERSQNTRLPLRSDHLSLYAILFHCVSIDKGDNFIYRDYRPIINIRYIFFSFYLHFSLNVSCNHSKDSLHKCYQ